MSDNPPLPETLSVADAAAMTGYEFMRGVLEGHVPPAPIAKVLGFDLHRVDEGRVVFRGTPSRAVTNPLGAPHGGWYGAVLDSAMACAVMTHVPKGCYYTTLEYKINITRPIPLDMEIECVGWTNHAGKSTGVASGEIRGLDNGKLYATGSTTCIILPVKQSG